MNNAAGHFIGIKPNKYETINEHYAKVMGGRGWMPPKQSPIKKVPIDDIPIMITRDGTVVCIPKLPEMGVIAVVGRTGTGKTLSLGRIFDELFYNWGDYVALMNDSQDESFSWSEPNDTLEFIYTLKKINQKPMPLPMVYVYPSSDKDEQSVSNSRLLEGKSYITVSVPFVEVLKNIEKYLPDLGKSEKYLMERKDDLLKVESEEDLMEVIESIPEIDANGKPMQAIPDVKNKLKVSFKTLINEGILNVSNPNIPSYLRTNKMSQVCNPFTAIMQAQGIPAFITSELYHAKFKDAVYSYYVSALFEENKRGSMKGKRVWLVFDELTRVVHANPKYNSPETLNELSNVASRGRNNTICLVYSTQRYGEIPKTIRTQTKFALVFANKEEDAKEIADDFGLGKIVQKEIVKLKKYEAYAITSEYFVCYKDNKKWEEKVVKGMIIPPLHKNRFLHKVEKDQ